MWNSEAPSKFTNASITVTTPSAEEPITLAEAKAWLKITTTDDDAVLTGLITSAVRDLESYVKQPLITKTFLYKTSYSHTDLDGEEFLFLPYVPTNTPTVTLYDLSSGSNVLTTSTTYGKKVLLGDHGITVRNDQGYHVSFQAGIAADQANTPELIKMVMKSLVEFYYERNCGLDKNQVLSAAASYINMQQIAYE